jgi:RNA polymerase sigma-70 factor, ECF subfamily
MDVRFLDRSNVPVRMTRDDPSREGIAATDYERLRSHLSRAVARVCPRMLADRRDDLVQDCFIRVMDVARRSEGELRVPSSYLYKVAHSALVDEIRRVRRKRETALEEGEPVPCASPDGNPEAVAAGREIGRGILGCLAGLLRERRLGVTLYLQGHSVPEAARILEWSAKKTENLVFRGLADLRQCLAAKGFKP